MRDKNILLINNFIKLEDGLKIWFVLYDHPLKGVVIIRGLSDEGKTIDKDLKTIYDE